MPTLQQHRHHSTKTVTRVVSGTLVFFIFFFFLSCCLSGSTCFAQREESPTRLLHSSSTSSSLASSTIPSNGPIDDTLQCNIEELERANDSQLHSILQELKQTEFFKHFVVDLEHKCPLSAWTRGGHVEDDTADEQQQQEEEFECTGGNNHELELDFDAEPLCTVQAHDHGGDDDDDDDDPISWFFNNNNAGSSSSQTDRPPLHSNALYSLSQDGFHSKAQQDTFTWKQHSDTVQTNADRHSKQHQQQQQQQQQVLQQQQTDKQDDVPCDDVQETLPDTFWLDICSNIKTGDGKTVVNLQANPERNTGYNGTHIWKAIYEENCILPSNGGDLCLEERVLYRLFSGLHTSTTISIAKNYYPPSKRKGRDNYEANPTYFYQKFESHPDHVRNLHFSFAVLLRALRKAKPFLYNYEIRTGNIVDDETATVLLRRLLDSTILQSCLPVFDAFDESLLFREEQPNVISLQQNFKGVFHNVSSILDCVQCQQCKLHGKLTMLGYGAALKVLFTKQPQLQQQQQQQQSPNNPYAADSELLLDRNEIVALVNSLARFSESIAHVRELTHLYWQQQQQQPQIQKHDASASDSSSLPTTPATTTFATLDSTGTLMDTSLTGVEAVDAAVGVVAALGKRGLISTEREVELVQLALNRHAELLILARHYGHNNDVDLQKFLLLTGSIGSTGNAISATTFAEPDAIVVGSGLAGMAATLHILDRGGRVVLLEKEHLLGGNSNKASSGINAYVPYEESITHDSLELFRNDTIRSAGTSARPDLIEVIVSNSAKAIEFLKTRVGVDLSLLSQLGGHSTKRTHRPSNGMAGAEIIYGLQKAIRAYEKTGHLTIMVDTRVTKLITSEDGQSVVGVEYIQSSNNNKTSGSAAPVQLHSPNVVLATGGFAADRSIGSYLEKYRPELLKMPTTAGAFSTGDGITLATTLGAGVVDMDKVQIHPTGWVDPADPDNTSKILAAELMRGVGGLLINRDGKRFCNELGTRAYVTEKMLSHNRNYAKTGKWDSNAAIPTFWLVLSSSAAQDGKKHVDLYTHKGLLTRVEGVTALSKKMKLPESTIVATLKEYQKAAAKGNDQFDKTTFRGVPAEDLQTEVFYVGQVTPVLHYCMGGITIDKEGHVLNANGEIIPGLNAAGEVTGGVHGVNRLAGNSLLECTVFGTIVGQRIPIRQSRPVPVLSVAENDSKASNELRQVATSELGQHNTPEDCWVAIHGMVYDLTEFAHEHPAGPQSIHELAGKDGTEAFSAVHNQGILDDFEDLQIGTLDSSS